MENNPAKTDQQNRGVEKILEAIREKKVSMRPRTYFILRMAALLSIAIAVLIVSVFIFGFIFWSVTMSGQSLLLGFGTPGWLIFLTLFPWWLLLLDVALLILFESLMRQFSFGYRVPVLYLLIALLLGSATIGILLEDFIHVQERIGVRVQNHQIPVLSGWYDSAAHPSHSSEVCKCLVVGIGTSTLFVTDEWDFATVTPAREEVMFADASTTSGFKIGDQIFIIGRETGRVLVPQSFQRISQH